MDDTGSSDDADGDVIDGDLSIERVRDTSLTGRIEYIQ